MCIFTFLLCVERYGLLFFFDCYHLPAAVFTATGTNAMRQGRLATIRTRYQIGGLERVVRTAAATPPVRDFSFR
jgi:hypothetical protein